MTEQRRTPLKNRSPRQELWRDRFKKQCETRLKDARSTHILQRRENQWLQQMIVQEWNRFRQENETALKLEAAHVTENLEAAIEENLLEELQEIYDPTWDELLQLEQDELTEAFERYQLESSGDSTETTHIPSNASEKEADVSTMQKCYACKNGILSKADGDDPSIWKCSNCHIRVPKEGLELLQQHSSNCPGTVLYTQNSPEDVIILCTDCELCAAL